MDAARGLFSEQEYFSTNVDNIALRATIYAVSGGKQGLLNTLMDIWSRAPIVSATLDRVDLDDPAAILRTVAVTCCKMREEFGDIMRVLLATAPHDKPVARVPGRGDREISSAARGDRPTTGDLDALREGMDVEQAVDVLWFYFGYSGLFSLRENGWSYERAERWLGAQANWVLRRIHALC